MGLFDDFLKQVDDGLKAVESGALEKRLNQFADAVEKKTEQASDTLRKTAEKPAEVLKIAEQKKAAVEQGVQVAKRQAGKAMDIIHKKD